MKEIIKETSSIKNILHSYPEVFPVFALNGFRYDSIESFIDAVGEKTMLKTITRIRNINTELFIKQMENEIFLTKKEKNYLLNDVYVGDKVDFFANIIFPIKMALITGIEEIVRNHYEETGELFKAFVKAGKKAKEYSENIKTETYINEFPSVFVTKEFKDPFAAEFKKFVDKGHFTGDLHRYINKDFLGTGIIDPRGDYCVYGVIPVVFLVDKDLLGDLPMPRETKDLLNEVYKDNIIIFGREAETITSPSFIYIYKEFGEEGIRKLSHNVKSSVKSIEMTKIAGTKGEDAAAIYILPWFFAKTCYKKNLEIVWPVDGAMTIPMYMLVKKESKEEVKPLIDYIIGEEFGEICAKSNMPSVNASVDNHLPSNARFKWIGWDYIRENDVIKIEEKCEEIFMEEIIKSLKGGSRS